MKFLGQPQSSEQSECDLSKSQMPLCINIFLILDYCTDIHKYFTSFAHHIKCSLCHFMQQFVFFSKTEFIEGGYGYTFVKQLYTHNYNYVINYNYQYLWIILLQYLQMKTAITDHMWSGPVSFHLLDLRSKTNPINCHKFFSINTTILYWTNTWITHT